MPKAKEEKEEEERREWFVCRCLRDFLRSPVGRHLLNARREMLLALRACVDAKIERIERLLEETDEPKEIPVQ